jgi:2-amino-4-hydroxy-6-hydroxymethyldihydropteridine diphosphokinase
VIGYLGLGSNVGDRRANMQAAVDAMPGRGITVVASSSTYDTDPVGEILDQPDFLNACIRIETGLAIRELLDTVKDIELRMGRDENAVRHAPRPIDIDILLLGEIEHHDERLNVPHADLLVRRFVLIPMLELDFELATPAGERLSDALAALPLDEGVTRQGPPLTPAG